LPRTPTGGFVLRPGAWTFAAQSYCLKAGTYERTGGAGYHTGPLGGKLAPTISALLTASYQHPEVPQPDIQRVIWSFLAGMSYTELPPPQQAVANTLLTPDQIRQATMASAQIPAAVSSAVLSRLPRVARELIAVRQRLRAAAARPGTQFADLERIAVLTGLPPSTGTEIPGGRWSWNRKGFFVRCSSETYRRTQIDLIVPEPLRIRRDQKGRVTQWSLADGRRVDFTYREDLGSVRFRKSPDLPLYFFNTVIYTLPAAPGSAGRPMVTTYRNKGYCFVNERKFRRAGRATGFARHLDHGLTLCQSPESEVIDGVSEDIRDRLIEDGIELSGSRAAEALNEARERQEAADDLSDLGTPSDDPAGDIADLAGAENVREGMDTVVTGDTSDRLGFIADFHRALARALAGAEATLREGMSGTPDGADGGGVGAGGSGSGGGPVFDPPGNTGYPSGSGQIRGNSGRGWD
jgi:hypothetical protein